MYEFIDVEFVDYANYRMVSSSSGSFFCHTSWFVGLFWDNRCCRVETYFVLSWTKCVMFVSSYSLNTGCLFTWLSGFLCEPRNKACTWPLAQCTLVMASFLHKKKYIRTDVFSIQTIFHFNWNVQSVIKI